jgi:site-specific DNA-adenine methylase
MPKGHETPVNKLDMEGNFVQQYPSIKAAAESVDGSPGNINMVCQGFLNHAKGCKFQYCDPDRRPSKEVAMERRSKRASIKRDARITKKYPGFVADNSYRKNAKGLFTNKVPKRKKFKIRDGRHIDNFYQELEDEGIYTRKTDFRPDVIGSESQAVIIR